MKPVLEACFRLLAWPRLAWPSRALPGLALAALWPSKATPWPPLGRILAAQGYLWPPLGHPLAAPGRPLAAKGFSLDPLGRLFGRQRVLQATPWPPKASLGYVFAAQAALWQSKQNQKCNKRQWMGFPSQG